jgi:polyphosphate kinase
LTEPYPIDGDLLMEQADAPTAEPSEAPSQEQTTGSSEADGGDPGALERFGEHWYEPDSHTYAYAVRTPDGDRVYRKTADGAAAVLQKYYRE